MIDPLNAQALLRAHKISPTKKLGQNFIISEAALQQVLSAASLTEGESVLEIGAGLGALTLALASRELPVIAVELDRRLIPILEQVVGSYQQVQILHGDILHLKPEELNLQAGFVVVANIPYQITSAIIRHLMDSTVPASRIILTVQKEVAQRITAMPGELSLLALGVQVFGQPHIHSNIPASAFFPKPGVDSSVLVIRVFPEPLMLPTEIDLFFRVAKAGFSQKRKQLKNSLAAGLQMAPREVEQRMGDAGLQPSRRAQELNIEEWRLLCRQFKG